MIFKQWQDVLDGIKTQTRRLVRHNDYLDLECTPAEVRDNKCRLRWRIGNVYSVQPGRGKEGVGRIRITEIRRERLQQISFNDMLCEGYPIALFSVNFDKNPTVRDWFVSLWNRINRSCGTLWHDNPEVWVLVFEAENDLP